MGYHCGYHTCDVCDTEIKLTISMTVRREWEKDLHLCSSCGSQVLSFMWEYREKVKKGEIKIGIWDRFFS